ncbi:MAG: hypothetical protein Q7T60_17115 [Sphingopyxis sp.]|nr:hypothetical protein [Sphingopyxis sp.]
MSYHIDQIPAEAVGLKLFRIDSRENLIACESIRFVRGRPAVDTVLRRAAISGRVEVNGKIADHFADVLDSDESIIETVALDANSYRSLKNRWMRCKVDRPDRSGEEVDRG